MVLRLLVLALVFTAADRAWASSIQSDAPSANPASPAWLDRAGFPVSGAIALDQPLGDDDASPALTMSASPFAVMRLCHSSARPDPDDHPRFGGLRRVGLRLTLGGPTSRGNLPWFTRGQEETDHVTAELKLRVLGNDSGRLVDSHLDRPMLLSLALTADTYSTGFGRDLYAATLIADSESPSALTANLGYRREEKLHHGHENHELKLGLGRTWRWYRNPRAFGSMEVMLAVGGLIRDRGREDVRLANTRVDLPLGRPFRLTTSLALSNVPERTGEGRLRARLGIGYGL